MTASQDRSSRLKARLSEAEATPKPSETKSVEEQTVPKEVPKRSVRKEPKSSYRDTHTLLGVWLHNDLLHRLDEAAEKLGVSKASIVSHALAEDLARRGL